MIATPSSPEGSTPDGEGSVARGETKRIQYVIAGFPSPGADGGEPTGIGGSEIQSLRVARLLPPRLAVEVITEQPLGRPAHDVVDDIPVRRIKLVSGGSLAAAMDAWRIVRTGVGMERPHLIQGFQLNGVTLAAAALARTRRVPLVIKITGRGNLPSILSTQMGSAKLRFLLSTPTAIVAPSVACRDDLRAHGIPDRMLHVIPNGVDVNLFSPPSTEERETARAAIGLAPDRIAFSWVGRLDPDKGFETIVNAWPMVIARDPRLSMIVAGNGSQAQLARSLIAAHPDSVKWLGVLDDVRHVYAAADANLMTSPSEGLSNVLLEATACGLISVVPAVPENLDVAAGSDFLIGYDRTSVESLITGLQLAATLPTDDRRRRSVEGRTRVDAKYSLSSTAQSWTELYDSILRCRP